MRKLVPIISFAGLVLVIAPAILYLVGSIDKPTMKTVMLAGTVLWFATVPLWMGRKNDRE